MKVCTVTMSVLVWMSSKLTTSGDTNSGVPTIALDQSEATIVVTWPLSSNHSSPDAGARAQHHGAAQVHDLEAAAPGLGEEVRTNQRRAGGHVTSLRQPELTWVRTRFSGLMSRCTMESWCR